MNRRISLALAGTLLCALTSPALASRETARQLNFDVYLDERPIGYQRFDLQPTREGLRVETQAEFELKLLRIKTLAYDHRNVEQWRGDCLESIASQTESNGKPYRVNGRASDGGFAVTSNEGSQRLTECVGTFSYWDKRQLLQRSRLLNSQTGEYLSVRSRPLGQGTLQLGDRSLPVERWLLEGEDLEITLAYALESGEWVALDSPLFGGFTLRYRRNASELGDAAKTPASTTPPASR